MRIDPLAFLARHEPPLDWLPNVQGSLGALIGMSAVGAIASVSGLHLLLAPLGATAVLLFGQPSSPLAQPINVLGGYLVGTVACEAAFYLFPGDWSVAALAVAVTIFLMRSLRITHPPAGAMPILGFSGVMHGVELFGVILLGTAVLIALAVAVHWVSPGRRYPKPREAPANP
jgi:CBS-domain-containing membrane protein